MDHLVFVFGTLKEGYPNFATNRGVRVPGVFRTREAYPLYLVGERHSPWLLDAPGEGVPVTGELYRVDGDALATMDRLERVTEPDGYHRKLLEFEGSAPSQRVSAFVYMKRAALLAKHEVRAGPLAEYGLEHARLYRPRAG